MAPNTAPQKRCTTSPKLHKVLGVESPVFD